MNRTMLIKTEHDLFTINGLKEVYISHHLIYKLIVVDMSNRYCIFWSFKKNSLTPLKERIIRADQNEEFIIYL